MSKRYQVFLSSTFADLREERQEVIETIMQMDCIPAGMELFPAADNEQFEFIKKVIDDCDYYILIIGGRYGSENFEGISFTEKEYDYAISKSIPVLAFIHGDPDNISFGKTEQDTEKRRKLDEFKRKVSSNRLIKFWTDKKELPGMVVLSLSKCIKMFPQPGWVRGGNYNNNELLEQLNSIRLENDKYKKIIVDLENDISGLRAKDVTLASGKDQVSLSGKYRHNYNGSSNKWEYSISWDEIFSIIGPFLFKPNNYGLAKLNFENALKNYIGKADVYHFEIGDNLFQQIKIQLLALELIHVYNGNTVQGGVAEFIQINDVGKRYLLHIKSIKKEE